MKRRKIVIDQDTQWKEIINEFFGYPHKVGQN